MTSDAKFYDASDEQRAAAPDTAWQADVRAGVRHVRDLDRLPLSPAERAAAQAAAANHKVRAPKAYLDLIDWTARRALPRARAYAGLCAEIERRLAGDPEPIGLLTHHLVHDGQAWALLDELL